MAIKFVYRTYRIFRTKSSPDAVYKQLTGYLLSNGYKHTGDENGVKYFRYPAITFTSKRPLTCISRLSLEVTGENGNVCVKIGANFTKIRYYIITVLLLMCVVIPAILGYVQHGIPDIPAISYLGIPLGIMAHYQVRWRVFKALQRLISQMEEE